MSSFCFVPVKLFSGLASVAVSTAYYTFINFCFNPSPTKRILHQVCDSFVFSVRVYVVEFQYHDVAFTTINAMVVFEPLRKAFSIFSPALFLPSSCVLFARICFCISALTITAIKLNTIRSVFVVVVFS